GLATVYGFVTQSGGHVKAYSELGHGTTVKLFFPSAAGPISKGGSASPRPKAARGHGEVILLVEDEPAVRVLGKRLLQGLGYRVLEAPDGRTAIDIARQEVRLDLLLTDVVLPGGMSGHDLARSLAVERPGLPVVYASGYSPEIVQRRGQLDPSIRLVPKPYDRAQLAEAVHAALAPSVAR